MALNVDYQKLNSCIDNLKRLNKEMNENLNNYVQFGTSLQKNSAWSGIVSDNYTKDINQLHNQIDEINNQILNITSKMQNAYNHYQETEKVVKDKFSNIFYKVSRID